MKEFLENTQGVVAFKTKDLPLGVTAGEKIDLLNANSCTFFISVTNTGGQGITPILEHSDDNVSYVAVPSGNINGTLPGANLNTNGSIAKLGYLGDKRYVRLSINNSFLNSRVNAIAVNEIFRNNLASTTVVLPDPIVPANLVLWYDASYSPSITLESGSKVSKWANIAPTTFGSNDATQLTPANQPTYAPTGNTGHPGIQADGLTSYLGIPDASVPFGDQQYTYILVASAINDGGSQPILSTGDFSVPKSNVRHKVQANNFAVEWVFYVQVNSALPYVDNQARIIHSDYDGSLMHFYDNDTFQNQFSGNVRAQTVGPNYMFYDGTSYFNGEVSEILVYDRALTPTERTNIFNALVTKWSIIL